MTTDKIDELSGKLDTVINLLTILITQLQANKVPDVAPMPPSLPHPQLPPEPWPTYPNPLYPPYTVTCGVSNDKSD